MRLTITMSGRIGCGRLQNVSHRCSLTRPMGLRWVRALLCDRRRKAADALERSLRDCSSCEHVTGTHGFRNPDRAGVSTPFSTPAALVKAISHG